MMFFFWIAVHFNFQKCYSVGSGSSEYLNFRSYLQKKFFFKMPKAIEPQL